MSLFYTSVFVGDDGEAVDYQVSGPFSSDREREESIEELVDEHGSDSVYCCPFMAIADDDEVNVLIE